MRKNIKWFTLVELLVVITILAIISVVAYQNFGWATDKANASRKISDVATIETSLQQYFVDKNSYPPVDLVNPDTNVYGYNSAETATPSNTLVVTKNWAEITAVTSAKWGWKIIWTWNYSSMQIWAKWTISQDTLGKQYLTKDLYDPELWDIKIWSQKLIDKWIWRYVYAVYKKPTWSYWWNENLTWAAYNIAYTVKKEGSEDYMTRIVWPYDEKSCVGKESSCTKTLIWSGIDILINNQVLWKKADGTALSNFNSTQTNKWIPYQLGNF